MDPRRRGVVLGLAAAASFGISAPIAKRLLEHVGPSLLAGLLYLGAFVVLVAVVPFRTRSREARVQRSDLPRVALLVAAGGVVAPVLLLVGLERMRGSAGSLLLNLEGPLTLLVALVAFGEHLGRRPAVGAAAIFGGAALLSTADGGTGGSLVGLLCIAGACALWAIDNNLTQALTVRDPVTIVTIKAGAAGSVNTALAVVLGAHRPAAGVVVAALVLGAVSYGASVVLDAYALRALGAAREAAIFAAAPFVGAVVAVPVLSESITSREIVAAMAMGAGVALMLTERHDHLHVHEPIVHEHVHVHDEHHRHDHPPGVDAREPHSHAHRHDAIVHAHRHVSDVHHRHAH